MIFFSVYPRQHKAWHQLCRIGKFSSFLEANFDNLYPTIFKNHMQYLHKTPRYYEIINIRENVTAIQPNTQVYESADWSWQLLANGHCIPIVSPMLSMCGLCPTSSVRLNELIWVTLPLTQCGLVEIIWVMLPLTHCGLVMPYTNMDVGQDWFR